MARHQTAESILRKFKKQDEKIIPVAEGIHIPNLSGIANAARGVAGIKIEDLKDVTITAIADNEVLTFDTATSKWENQPGGGGSGTMTTVKEGGTQLGGADIVTLDFDGSDFDLTETPDTEVNIVINDGGIDHNALLNFVSGEHFLQSAITTTGTITSGTWNGTTIAILNGGTGQTTQTAAFDALAPTTTVGDIIVFNGTDNIRLAKGADTNKLVVDATQATDLKWISGELSKSISVEDPTGTEDITFFFTNRAITLTEMRAVLLGSATPSVTWQLFHATDRNAAGTQIDSNVTTNTTTGDDITVFDDATIPADSFVWFETSAQSGTVDEISVTVIFTEDP